MNTIDIIKSGNHEHYLIDDDVLCDVVVDILTNTTITSAVINGVQIK